MTVDSPVISARHAYEEAMAERNGQHEEANYNELPAAPVAKAVCLANVTTLPVEWCWEGRIPFGALTDWAGDPGTGKSLTTCDIAARVTTASAMPNEVLIGEREPSCVLMLNAEDDLNRTIRPRLEAMGADLGRVYALEEIAVDKQRRPPMLPDDVGLIEEVINDYGIRLVVIDPFMAFLSGEVDPHKDADVRRVMFAMRKMAERTQAAVVIVRHLNKQASVSDPMYRGGGSIGIIGAMRSAFIVAPDPENPDRCILARVKGNLCAPPPSLSYSVVQSGAVAKIEWGETVDVGAGDLLVRTKEQKASEQDEQKIRTASAKLLAALDREDPNREGMVMTDVLHAARISKRDYIGARRQLIDEGVVEGIMLERKSGRNTVKPFEGIRRKPKD